MSKVSTKLGASAGAAIIANTLYSIWIMIDAVTGRELDIADGISLGATLMFCLVLVINSSISNLKRKD